jgi:hypothetical protein
MRYCVDDKARMIMMLVYASINLCIGLLFKLMASEKDGNHSISGTSLKL